MQLNKELIRKFCKKQSMNWDDRQMQFAYIEEELSELKNAKQHEEEVEEAVDVLVTVLVYAEISGWSNEIEKGFEKKMDVNNKKKVRVGKESVPHEQER